MKEDVGFRPWPRVGVRNSEWEVLQGQRLTVQSDGILVLGADYDASQSPRVCEESPRSFSQEM